MELRGLTEQIPDVHMFVYKESRHDGNMLCRLDCSILNFPCQCLHQCIMEKFLIQISAAD